VLQLAGLFNAVLQAVVLGLQLVLTACAGITWTRGGRPRLFGPIPNFRFSAPGKDWRSWGRLLVLALLGGAVTYVYLRHAEVILAVVPGNYDAMTYHLSRVGYWLQYHSFYPWPTPNPRQTTFPMNTELGLLWTILWWGSDRLTGFVQWISVPATMLGVYGIARLLRYSRWQSALTAFLWATLTQVLMQSSTTQNDLVTTVFWVASTYFFFYGLKERSRGMAALSGAAFGLALGAKSTSLLVLPGAGLMLVIAAAMYHRGREFWPRLRRWAFAFLGGAVLFGSYVYVQNVVAFGNPLGASTGRTGPAALHADAGVVAYAERLRDNLARYAYQYAELAGLPANLDSRLQPAKDAVFSTVYEWLGVSVDNPRTIGLERFGIPYINPPNENSSWFGPLAIFLVPAALIAAYRGVRRRNLLPVFLLLVGVGFLLAESALQRWTPYKGRYFVVPVAVAFPMLAVFLSDRTAWRAALTASLVLLGLVSMWTVTRHDSLLRQIGWRDVLSGGRRYPSTWFNEFDYRMLTSNVPADAAIGTSGGLDFRDYPLFGTRFTHRVTLAVPEESSLRPAGDIGTFESDFRTSDYMFLSGSTWPSAAAEAVRDFELMSQNGVDTLWIRRTLRSADECDADKWPFRDFFRARADMPVCVRFPIAPGGGRLADSPPPLIDTNSRFVPLVGSEKSDRLRFDILVKTATPAEFSIQFAPAQDASGQTLQLIVSQLDSLPEVHTATINMSGLAKVRTSLGQGLHTVELGLVGDSAPLRVPRFEVALPKQARGMLPP
jgi:4-amino-4-deoxy-L-arabinose transferase-like glycosyltransferase